MNFAKFLRTPFSQNTSGRLLLIFELIFKSSKLLLKYLATILHVNFYKTFCKFLMACVMKSAAAGLLLFGKFCQNCTEILFSFFFFIG